jgi:hypothetical protein
VGEPRKGRQARESQANLFAGSTLCRAAAGLACAPAVKPRRGWLQKSPGGEGETPREDQAHEGRGSRYGLNHRRRVQTLAGSKALKWDPVPMGPCQQQRRRDGGLTSGEPKDLAEWRGDREADKPQEGKGVREGVRLRGWENPEG